MNLGSLRNKQRQLHRALESIAQPIRNLKVVTQCQERPSYAERKITLIPDSRQNKGSKRYSRGRHLVSQQNQSISKYRSLELGSRNRKISQPKFERDGTVYESGMHRSIKKKTSGHNIPPQYVNDKHLMRTRRYSRKEPSEIKQMVRQLMKKGQFQSALSLLSQYQETCKSDVQFIELKGVCYLRMFKYDKALEQLSRIVIFDRKKSRQAYIWCALCENQLNNPQKCMAYIDECIRLFPDDFEAYYFKGKLLLKKKLYNNAQVCLKHACSLNPQKQQICLYIAECTEMMGNFEEAINQYQKYLKDTNSKNIGFMAKLSRLLVKMNRIKDSDIICERCIDFCDKQGYSSGVEDTLLECAYMLTFQLFKLGQFEKSLMKGQWILTRGKSKWSESTIKVMMASKVSQRDFYGAINIAERLQLLGCKSNLGELGQFCNGVILLMRKKALDGAIMLQQCLDTLDSCEETEINHPIRNVIHLYLFYAYCLAARDEDALEQLELQKIIGITPLYSKAALYNQAVIRGFSAFNKQLYTEAYDYFMSAKSQGINKSDPLLYLAFSLFPLARKNQQKKQQLEFILNECCRSLEDSNGNFASYAFYLRALIGAWKGEWSNALMDMDFAIDKAEDNVSSFFYLRALCWACVQNYKQAISDCSIAIELDPDSTDSYLLRVRCLQIEGDPGLAFNDLQSFIALKPQDKEIHKLAGHLLFENGAFEDALQAYKQGDINQLDTQVFLTRSKTHFLLGNFEQAAKDMLQAAHSSGDSPLIIFDYQMMKWLGQLFLSIPKQNSEKQFFFDKDILKKHLSNLQNIYEEGISHLGKIFKQAQYLTFSAMCCFLLEDYEAAKDRFSEVVKVKKASFMSESEGDFQQDEAEKRMFVNQMYYNLALCYCVLKSYEKAEDILKKCKIDPQLHTYEIYEQLLGHIKGTKQIKEDEDYLDLFSYRNKISRFLPRSKIHFPYSNTSQINYRLMKLCIPYPKVQPPNINPSFNSNLLDTVTLLTVERRPEAPWIFKEHNAVKFTDKMEVYSKLSLGESSVDNVKKVDLMGDSSSQSINLDIDLKKKLRLDSKVELKLNKMLAKN